MDIWTYRILQKEWRGQAEHCRRNDAPITASIIIAQLALMNSSTRCGQTIANWARQTS